RWIPAFAGMTTAKDAGSGLRGNDERLQTLDSGLRRNDELLQTLDSGLRRNDDDKGHTMGIFNFMSGRKLEKAELNGALGADTLAATAGILTTPATLDAMDARVIVLDATHSMVMVNAAARQMLMQAEVEMRKTIP